MLELEFGSVSDFFYEFLVGDKPNKIWVPLNIGEKLSMKDMNVNIKLNQNEKIFHSFFSE